jgi:hypothetical protein
MFDRHRWLPITRALSVAASRTTSATHGYSSAMAVVWLVAAARRHQVSASPRSPRSWSRAAAWETVLPAATALDGPDWPLP